MSKETENNWLAILGVITAALTIAIQLVSLGEMKGQFISIQETLKSDINSIKAEIQLIKSEGTSASNKLADLNARVINIERKL